MIPADLHFEFLNGMYLFGLALLIPCLGWWLYNFRNDVLEKFASMKVLEDIIVYRSRVNYWGKIIALSLTLFFATLAWMEPVGNGHYPPGVKPTPKPEETTYRRRVHDVIFLVDASASMSVKDTRTGISRLDEAKEIVDETVSRLKGENASLWAFTAEPTMLSPLTMDYLFVRLRLKQMDINEGDVAGTDFAAALEDIRKEYFSTLSPRYRTLVILSDGEDTSDREKDNGISTIVNLVGQADELNLHVFTVGLGSKVGGVIPNLIYEGKSVKSHLESDLLQALAKRGRGEYYSGESLTAVQIAKELVDNIQKEGGFENINREASNTLGNADLIYELYFQIPLGLAIILLIFAMYFPDTRKKRVP